jgi:hypothetical protein
VTSRIAEKRVDAGFLPGISQLPLSGGAAERAERAPVCAGAAAIMHDVAMAKEPKNAAIRRILPPALAAAAHPLATMTMPQREALFLRLFTKIELRQS